MAKDKSPAFQFYPNDWLSSASVSLMTPAEEGAYIRLLAIAWMQPDCGLPDDDAELAILSRLNRQWFKGSGDKLRKKFTRVNGRLFNDRLIEESQKQHEWRKRCSDGGKKGMEHRHGHKAVITTLPENDKVDTSRPLIRDHVRFDNSSSSSSSSSISPNGEIPPNPPNGGLDGVLFDAEAPTPGPSLVLPPVSATRKRGTPRNDLEGFTDPWAQKLSTRHPGPNGAGPAEVRVLLAAICRQFKAEEYAATLDMIDRNHASMCLNCPKWRDDGGKYAMGLANWLAPTMKRWASGYTANMPADKPTFQGTMDPEVTRRLRERREAELRG